MEYGVKLYIEIEQEKQGELNMKKEMVQAYISRKFPQQSMLICEGFSLTCNACSTSSLCAIRTPNTVAELHEESLVLVWFETPSHKMICRSWEFCHNLD